MMTGDTDTKCFRFPVDMVHRTRACHSAYVVLTLWSLGVEPAILGSSYEENVKSQVPAFPSPSPITHQTWKDHLGDDKYYQAYISFFEDELKIKSFNKLLEEYVFEASANVIMGASSNQPKMLDRFFAGLLHPMIHTGFGLEFTLPGILAEALAMTAVHEAEGGGLLPPEWFLPAATSFLSQFVYSVAISNKGTKPNIHAFTILSRILNDPELGGYEDPGHRNPYPGVVQAYGKTILKYLDKKVEELIWTMVLLMPGSHFKAEFYLMHLLTRSSQIQLLRGYFAVCMAWYVGRFLYGCKNATSHSTRPSTKPAHRRQSLTVVSRGYHPNSWLPIIQSTLAHPDSHLPKLQRALNEYSAHFGLTPAGTCELIDGTLFIRAAGLTFSSLGWVREGEAPGAWNEEGFFTSSDVCIDN
ncbi:hypothetical protein BJ912DRAFT_944822 [Pholiota molesta]|nr:hypothetical protein BJ912DRAFT_944822 [Pholiota molesta]